MAPKKKDQNSGSSIPTGLVANPVPSSSESESLPRFVRHITNLDCQFSIKDKRIRIRRYQNADAAESELCPDGISDSNFPGLKIRYGRNWLHITHCGQAGKYFSLSLRKTCRMNAGRGVQQYLRI